MQSGASTRQAPLKISPFSDDSLARSPHARTSGVAAWKRRGRSICPVCIALFSSLPLHTSSSLSSTIPCSKLQQRDPAPNCNDTGQHRPYSRHRARAARERLEGDLRRYTERARRRRRACRVGEDALRRVRRPLLRAAGHSSRVVHRNMPVRARCRP